MKCRNFCIILFCVFFLSCANTQNKTETEIEDAAVSQSYIKKEKGIVGLINGEIFCIPSPYNFSKHIHLVSNQYNTTLLNTPLNKNKYVTPLKKAINLGIYGIDLAYINTFSQSADALQYFSTIKTLSDELGLFDVFDIGTIERIENNINSQDSVLNIITNKYREADMLLKNDNQKKQAALILTGSWIESLYLLTQIEKETPHPQTRKHIAEHMFSAKSILGLLKPHYKTSKDFTQLIDNIVNICYWFDGISYEYTYIKPITYPNLKRTVFTSKSEVKIYPEHLENITKEIKKLRTLMIQ